MNATKEMQRLSAAARRAALTPCKMQPELEINSKPIDFEICKRLGSGAADSRVCHGYSEHLHAAIGLFETLADKIQTWFVSKNETECQVEIVAKNGATISRTGERMSLAIAEAVLELLNAASKPPKPFYTGHWRKSCDHCEHAEPHYCRLYSRPMKNMDLKRCRDWQEQNAKLCGGTTKGQ